MKELDRLSHLITETNQQAITQKIKLNNEISQRQQDLEKLEDQKSRAMAENQEVTTKKMKKTTEHGQILMSIDNLFQKCQARKELIISKEFMSSEPRNFDNMHLSGTNAIGQLQVIKQCLENFGRLNVALKDKEHIKKAIAEKRENNEIV